MGPTVVIVDDHAPFRAIARRLLEAGGFEVVGEAADGAAALAAARALDPALLLVDVQLPDIDGFEVALRIAAAHDPPAVVLISARGASSYRGRLRDTPARGFVAKSDLTAKRLTEVLQ